MGEQRYITPGELSRMTFVEYAIYLHRVDPEKWMPKRIGEELGFDRQRVAYWIDRAKDGVLCQWYPKDRAT